MGVNLRELFGRHPVDPGWYAQKRIAVDGHNVAFRYLTSIRGKDGAALRNQDGRVTSHLIGFAGLVRRLRALHAEPIVVWDGDVHPLKESTVRQRIEKRQEALRQAEAAREVGDQETYVKLMRNTVHLDDRMIQDCTSLLEALGVAVVRAPHDGERFAAALCHAGHADAVATEDYDALVAGAPTVLRKAGGGEPFLHHLQDVQVHGLEQRDLRHVAILCGTDWHPGVRGFGVKTALRAHKATGDLRRLVAEASTGTTRFHRLVHEGGLDLETFDALDAYIEELPDPEAPLPPRPSPDVAVSVADEFHMGRERVLACFC